MQVSVLILHMALNQIEGVEVGFFRKTRFSISLSDLGSEYGKLLQYILSVFSTFHFSFSNFRSLCLTKEDILVQLVPYYPAYKAIYRLPFRVDTCATPLRDCRKKTLLNLLRKLKSDNKWRFNHVFCRFHPV